MATISGLDIKREITQINLKGAEFEALLSGFVRACMSLERTFNDGLMLGLDCRTEFVRDYIMSAMLKTFKIKPKYSDASLMYADCEKLLRMLGIFAEDGGSYEVTDIPEKYHASASAYVRGMFLGCGSFSAHEAEGSQKGGARYHLEFSVLSETLADALIGLLAESDVAAHKIVRAEKYVVYVKRAENVCNALALMRLDKIVLKMYDTKTTLSLKKDVNRRMNCELANMTRTAKAAVDVADAIELIERTVGLDTLPPKLVEAADARKNSPDMTLAEIAYELGISKSGLKHRYDKIIEIANTIEKR